MYSFPILDPTSLIDFPGSIPVGSFTETDDGGITCVGQVRAYGMVYSVAGDIEVHVMQGTFLPADIKTYDLISITSILSGAVAQFDVPIRGKFIDVIIYNIDVVVASVRGSLWLRSI